VIFIQLYSYVFTQHDTQRHNPAQGIDTHIQEGSKLQRQKILKFVSPWILIY